MTTRAERIEAAAVELRRVRDLPCRQDYRQKLWDELDSALDLPAAPPAGEPALTVEQRAFYAAERAVKDWLERHFEKECDWLEHSRLESDAWAAYHAMVAAEARNDAALRGKEVGRA